MALSAVVGFQRKAFNCSPPNQLELHRIGLNGAEVYHLVNIYTMQDSLYRV